MSELVVLGPGGVGGFLAAALARAGSPVTVVAREATAAAIAERGLQVASVRLGEFHDALLRQGSLPLSVTEWILLDDRSALEEALR